MSWGSKNLFLHWKAQEGLHSHPPEKEVVFLQLFIEGETDSFLHSFSKEDS
jgi:hypothetical protein